MVPASTHSMEPPGTATTPGVTAVAVLTSDRGYRISPTVRYRRVLAPNSESGCARCVGGTRGSSMV